MTRAHGGTGFVPPLRSCRRREGFEGQQAHGGEPCFATGGNAVNPRIGSGTQQGREVTEEQTVEVVRNHEGGTGLPRWHSEAEVGQRCPAGVDARGHVGGRAVVGPARAGPRTNPTRGGRASGVTRSRRPGRKRGSEGEPRPRGLARESSDPRRDDLRKTSKATTATCKAREEAGKADDPLRSASRGAGTRR